MFEGTSQADLIIEGSIIMLLALTAMGITVVMRIVKANKKKKQGKTPGPTKSAESTESKKEGSP